MGFVRSLAIESWTLYSVGMLLIACRMVSKRMKMGTWALQVDDYLMVFAAANFTCVVISVNEVAQNGSNYMSPDEAASLNPQQVRAAVFGSIMTLVLEGLTITCIWTVKACLLILYYRLTDAFHKQRLAIKLIAVYCSVGYTLVMSLCFGYWCHPIQEYWAVPVHDSQCATYYHHMMFATAWNISSDLMLLAIPIPIIIKSRLPTTRKVVLCCLLGLGVLNIVIAILNRYYNWANPNDLGFVYFYIAEVATAIYVGNMPLCWPLFRRAFSVGQWSRDRSDGVMNPNRPRTQTVGCSTGKRPLPRSIFSLTPSLWSVTRVGSKEENLLEPVRMDSMYGHGSRDSACATTRSRTV